MKKFVMIALVANWVHRDSDTRVERGRFNRHRVSDFPGFFRISGLLPVSLLSVRRPLIIRLLSITAVCTGLTIGGTGRKIFCSAPPPPLDSSQFLRNTVLFRAASRPLLILFLLVGE